MSDCPYCVRENADQMKRFGYGRSLTFPKIYECEVHQKLNQQTAIEGWNPPGANSVKSAVLDGWDAFVQPIFSPIPTSVTPSDPSLAYKQYGFNPITKQWIGRQYVCGNCSAHNVTKPNQDPNNIIQYCMVCGINSFIKWVS